MRISLEIPGGPLDVVISGYKKQPLVETGWWTVGGRKLQVSRRQDGPWTLTGAGLPAATKQKGDTLPASLRTAFRQYLSATCEKGETVSVYALDKSPKAGACGWGWLDSFLWAWSTPNDAGTVLGKNEAVAWMRQQARAVGIRLTVD